MDRDPNALIARSSGNLGTARSDQSQSRSQIATRVDSQSGGIHPLATHSSPRHVQSAVHASETQGQERWIGSMPSQTRHSLYQSHRPDHHQHQHAMQGFHQQHQQIELQSPPLHKEQRQTSHSQLGGYGGQSSALWSAAAGTITSPQPLRLIRAWTMKASCGTTYCLGTFWTYPTDRNSPAMSQR